MYRVLVLCVLMVLVSCTSDDDARRNPNLLDLNFRVDLNTNLPEYSTLNFPNNYVIVNNIGLRGVLVYNLDNTQYLAYELSDPNHTPNSCSRMDISGIVASCPCTDDVNEYNIVTGQPMQDDSVFGMKAYRAERIGNVISVSN